MPAAPPPSIPPGLRANRTAFPVTKAKRALPFLGLLGLTAGCFGGGTGSSSPTTSTLVAVDPADFLGDVPCADASGAMRRYVATIVDVTPGLDDAGTPFALPSTGPVSCLQQAAQGGAFVLAGHWYAADIQAYDRTDIKPLGTGSSVMVDANTGDVVTPRWTTSCGRTINDPDGGTASGASSAAYAVQYDTVFVRHCAALATSGAATPTRVGVALDSGALGTPPLELACGDGAGQVASFNTHLEGGSAPDQQSGCAQTALFDGLVARTSYRFDVQAFESGATAPSWGTHCSAKALDGATVSAVCDPLTDKGGIRVDVPAVLGALGMDCASLLSVTTLVQGSDPRTAVQLPPECEAAVQFDDLASGAYTLGVATTLESGAAGPGATCTVSVSPATTTTADCVPD